MLYNERLRQPRLDLPPPDSSLLHDRGFFKEILELHKRGGLGDGSPPAGAPVGGLGTKSPRSWLKHIVVYCNKF